ncbi:MAG: hypothetical protein A2X61_04735 [Ignavibacteria bacterium GWB2_35_12]|nr:MAG: hypothetical protein A2X63_06045 [Ignavibacteria bacterium GWA2_35_8]OGU37728.1 MAG: hypothetical protein A2X61_04735 [Ignavibacteria bacterium GWB2_35_12]OGU88653.1 MAG: hypothetical protein A2220_00335 [Ignavibacteria bacterium RIFOXYA2_FULL_35_10]OGV23224.1 MAG: hypothetical protein A2475_13290 [Ignavibacteria bacterium RIFOXYC2_FULL_35_21]
MNKETQKAHEAFLVYQNLGDGRTVEEVASKLNKSIQTIKKWKTKWEWEKRIKESKINTEGELNFDSLINEHTEMSLQISKSLEKLIEVLTEKLSNSDKYLGDMNLDDLVKLINNYIKSIPHVLDYIQSFTLEPIKEKELEESFSICKKVCEDEVALNLSLDILSRISN